MTPNELFRRLPADWTALVAFLSDRPWTELGDGLDGPARALLADLVRHVDRQGWLAVVVFTDLGGDPEIIGEHGALGHPADCPPSGPLASHPGWSYRFHGMGCAFEHEDGRLLDVDFVDGRWDLVDPHFYHRYLDSLPAPNLAQNVLRRPAPFREAWMADLSRSKAPRVVGGGDAAGRAQSVVRPWGGVLFEVDRQPRSTGRNPSCQIVGARSPSRPPSCRHARPLPRPLVLRPAQWPGSGTICRDFGDAALARHASFGRRTRIR